MCPALHANAPGSHCAGSSGHTSSALFNGRVSLDVTLCSGLTLWTALLQASRPSSKTGPSCFSGGGAVTPPALPSVRVAGVVSAVVRTGHTECGSVSRVALPVPPSSALHFLPLSSRRVEQAVTRPPSVLVVSHRGCKMTLLMALLCEVFLPSLTDQVEKKVAAIQTCLVALN